MVSLIQATQPLLEAKLRKMSLSRADGPETMPLLWYQSIQLWEGLQWLSGLTGWRVWPERSERLGGQGTRYFSDVKEA